MEILENVRTHWADLRGRTYDFMDLLQDTDLQSRLPFESSQDVLYQFHCMLGTQESWPPVLLEGGMQGWDCSLQPAGPGELMPVSRVREAMRKADQTLDEAFARTDWLRAFESGTTPLQGYLRLVEHESHHHGQIINLIYGCDLPLPDSWADSWALTR